jgi:hypothetical protein
MTIRLRLAKGGDAEILAMDGERVVLSSSLSSPPGSTLEASLDDGVAVRVKVRGCRKGEGGRFEIDGRLVDLTRALRERLK